MRNVTIIEMCKAHDHERKIDLRNGTLLVHFSAKGGVLGAYLVTSFRDNKNKYSGDMTNSYCSFVNIDDGTIAFEERCSRNTTEHRILSHLNPADYQGDNAVKEGQFLRVFKNGDFRFDITPGQESFI
jgi:hypothetical protein